MPGIPLIQRFIEIFSSFFTAVSRFLAKDFWIIAPISSALLIFGVIIFFVAKLSKKYQNIPAPPWSGEFQAVSFLSGRLCSLMPLGEKADVAEILPMLYEYAGFVRAAVCKTGGAVKLAADGSFIAYWGANASSSSPAHDALNAVRAALLIRLSFIQFNKDRTQAGKNPVYGVTGVSSGKMIAGCMRYDGKSQRILVGEPGILATKIRDSAERYAVDVIITSKTWRLIKEYLIAEELPAFESAETQEPVRLFAVVNLRAASSAVQPAPTTLSELRNGLYNEPLSKL